MATDVLASAIDTAPTSPNYVALSYVVPAICAGLAPCAGIAALRAGGPVRRLASPALASLPLILAAYFGVHRFAALDVHADAIAETWARAALAQPPDGSLIVASGDQKTFALWYGHDVLGLAPTAVVWSRELAVRPWYRELQARRNPGLVVPQATDGSEDALLVAIIRDNLPRRRVFSTDEWLSLERHYRFDRQGTLFEVRPR